MTNYYSHSFERSHAENGAVYSSLNAPLEIEGDSIKIIGVEVRNFRILNTQYLESGEVDLKFCFVQDDTDSVEPEDYKLVFFPANRQHASVESDSDVNGGFLLVNGHLVNTYVNYVSLPSYNSISDQVLEIAGVIAIGVFEASQ